MSDCNIVKIIEPVPHHYIKCNYENETIGYTDCFEISLLRWLHCIFGVDDPDSSDKLFNLEQLKYFTLDTPECTQLIEFFTKNQKIKLSSQYYHQDGSEGYKLRTDWCIFLNQRSFFRYKIQDKYKLCAGLNNLFTFFNVFLPKLRLDQPEDKMKMFNLAKKLSTNDLKIDINLITRNIKEYDNTYYYINDIYMRINNVKYNWHLYQYFKNDNDTFSDRITGHSELLLL